MKESTAFSLCLAINLGHFFILSVSHEVVSLNNATNLNLQYTLRATTTSTTSTSGTFSPTMDPCRAPPLDFDHAHRVASAQPGGDNAPWCRHHRLQAATAPSTDHLSPSLENLLDVENRLLGATASLQPNLLLIAELQEETFVALVEQPVP